jgi:cell division protein ZapA (FtsZ GTPase activity inhibitor)
MAHHPSTPTLHSGFRRRFPLELSPAEYARLEEAGRTAGSKRAALLAGLAALDDATHLRADAARTESAHHNAQATIAGLKQRIGELEQALTDAKEKAKTGAAHRRKATETAEAALAKSTRDAQWADEARATKREALLDTQAELDTLDKLFVDELRCPRCGKFAPSDEWASQRTKEGRIVFHKPCGYHEGGFLDETSVLGRRTAQ